MTDIVGVAYLIALALLVGLGVLRDRSLGKVADRLTTQLDRLENDRSALQAWFQSTNERVDSAVRNAQDARDKANELSGRVASLDSRWDLHINRTHNAGPGYSEAP